MILARNNVYQFTVSDITSILNKTGLNPDDIIISPVYRNDRFYLYLMNKYDWKTYIILSDRNNYGLIVSDVPIKQKFGNKIYFDDSEPWYKLWWKKVISHE